MLKMALKLAVSQVLHVKWHSVIAVMRSAYYYSFMLSHHRHYHHRCHWCK